jgi:hypothetical protein
LPNGEFGRAQDEAHSKNMGDMRSDVLQKRDEKSDGHNVDTYLLNSGNDRLCSGAALRPVQAIRVPTWQLRSDLPKTASDIRLIRDSPQSEAS